MTGTAGGSPAHWDRRCESVTRASRSCAGEPPAVPGYWFQLLLLCRDLLVSAGGRPDCAGPDWAPVVLSVGCGECLIDARFDIALRLATHCCQLRHYQVT